jgi:hypothetical protein
MEASSGTKDHVDRDHSEAIQASVTAFFGRHNVLMVSEMPGPARLSLVRPSTVTTVMPSTPSRSPAAYPHAVSATAPK